MTCGAKGFMSIGRDDVRMSQVSRGSNRHGLFFPPPRARDDKPIAALANDEFDTRRGSVGAGTEPPQSWRPGIDNLSTHFR